VSQTEVLQSQTQATVNHHRKMPVSRAALRLEDTSESAHTPPRSTTSYGKVPVERVQSQFNSPMGTTHAILQSGMSARISTHAIGTGATNIAYDAEVHTPNGTAIKAAAISSGDPPKIVREHALEFGHLVTFKVGDHDYVTLTKKGMPFDKVIATLAGLPGSNVHKLGFLLTYLIPVIDSLILIEDTGHVHQDVKPENMIILGRGQAIMIDNAEIPQVGDRRFGSTPGYRSPGRHFRLAAPSADVFALGVIIGKKFNSPPEDMERLVGLSDLLSDINQHRDLRPSLRAVKVKLQEILATLNEPAAIQAIEDHFFSDPLFSGGA
jgi:hypothetical protein